MTATYTKPPQCRQKISKCNHRSMQTARLRFVAMQIAWEMVITIGTYEAIQSCCSGGL